MREFPKPVVVVSKCITFEPVRWNGQIIASEFVEKIKPYVTFVPVCPEVEIGLGVPRDPIRIVLMNKKNSCSHRRVWISQSQWQSSQSPSWILWMRLTVSYSKVALLVVVLKM